MYCEYKPPFIFRNAYLSSIYPSFFRSFSFELKKTTNTVNTRDGDEVEYDWYQQGSDKVAIISHGLGGNNQRPYILGMVRSLFSQGWDVIAWNYRGSGEKHNLKPVMYHGGSVDDLEDVIHHVNNKGKYREIALVGFSLGGNISLLYLGKNSKDVPSTIKKAACFSVPCDLKSSAMELGKFKNKIFMQHFLKMFKKILTKKHQQYPNLINLDHFNKVRNFQEYDDTYTAPIHGFENANDYWEKCSCKRYLKNIKQDVLLVMARDDPFLGENCYPVAEAKLNSKITLLMPQYGGHVGFVLPKSNGKYWSEEIAINYLNN